MVQTPWYALSDFYRTAIKLLSDSNSPSYKAVAPPGTMTEWGYACCEAQAPLVRGCSPSEPVAVKLLENQSEGAYLARLVGCDDVDTRLEWLSDELLRLSDLVVTYLSTASCVELDGRTL